MTLDAGPLRTAYLASAKWLRDAMDGSALLESWTRYAIENPRTLMAHLRTLVAVHNADDLVRLDLPWWTYQAIDAVDEFLSSKSGRARVFEYGSGASTLWLARRTSSVTSIEHHPEWAKRVKLLIDQAGDLLCEPRIMVPSVVEATDPAIGSSAPTGHGLDFSAYVDTIDEVGGDFDLILIDGRAREACFRRAIHHVGEESLILLDDAQRRRYRPVLREAEAAGWHVEMTKGAAPCQPLPRQTALITRPTFQSSTP